MKKTLTLSLLLFTAGFSLKAQGLMDMGIQYTMPVYDLETGNYKDGIGFYLGGWSPEVFKGNGANIQFGGRFDLSWNGARHTDVIIDPGIDGDYSLSNLNFGGHAGMRLTAPRHARLRPYLDGYAGVRYFGTNIDLTIDEWRSPANGEVLFSEWPVGTWAFSYGGALGAQYWFNECIALDLRGILLTTNKPVTFADLETVTYTNDSYVYQTRSVRAPMAYFQVGITFKLSGACESCDDTEEDFNPGTRVYPNPNTRPHPGFQPTPGFRPAPNFRPSPSFRPGGGSLPRS